MSCEEGEKENGREGEGNYLIINSSIIICKNLIVKFILSFLFLFFFQK